MIPDAIDEWGDQPAGTISAFSTSSDGQKLDRLGSPLSTQGLWPCHGDLIPSDTTTGLDAPRLYCSNYKGQSIFSVSINKDGTFAADTVQVVSVRGDGLSPGPHPERQQQAHPHGTHVLRFPSTSSPEDSDDKLPPDQIFLVVPDLGTDVLRLFRVRSPDGKLEIGPTVPMPAGSGPRHVIFDSVSGSHADLSCLVLQELSNSVSVFSVSLPSPTSEPTSWPTFTPTQLSLSLLPRDGPPPGLPRSFTSWHAAELALSPPVPLKAQVGSTAGSRSAQSSQRYLLASNRASDHDPLNANPDPTAFPPDSIALWPIHSINSHSNSNSNGEPSSSVQIDERARVLVSAFGRAPRHFEFAPVSQNSEDRQWVAIALHDTNEIVVAEFVVGSIEGGQGARAGGARMVEQARLKNAGRPGVVMWARNHMT